VPVLLDLNLAEVPKATAPLPTIVCAVPAVTVFEPDAPVFMNDQSNPISVKELWTLVSIKVPVGRGKLPVVALETTIKV
jgi:hypothetical protein